MFKNDLKINSDLICMQMHQSVVVFFLLYLDLSTKNYTQSFVATVLSSCHKNLQTKINLRLVDFEFYFKKISSDFTQILALGLS